MQWSDNKANEKFGFWLVLYSYFSLYLIAFLLSQPKQIGLHLVVIPIIIPCLLGGVGFLLVGKKFNSAIYICLGVVILLPLSFVSSERLQYKFAALFTLGLLCLLSSWNNIMNIDQKPAVEKHARYLAAFALLAPLITYGIYLFAKSVSVTNPWDLFPSGLDGLAVPIAMGGIIYLFIGAKHRSYKYASMGFASLYIAYVHFVLTATLAIRFMD